MKSFINKLIPTRALPLRPVVAALSCVLLLSGCEYLDDFDKDNEDRGATVLLAKLKPLNNSGVEGIAKVVYKKDGIFKVIVDADHLVPNKAHPQHIHGFDMEDKDAVCPPASAAGDDGLLTLADGLPFYGPVLLPLDDKLVPLDADNFPKAYDDGNLHYYNQIRTSALVDAIDDKYEEEQTIDDFKGEDRVVVIHGAYVKDNKIVSPGTEGAKYEATLPVACGELVKQ